MTRIVDTEHDRVGQWMQAHGAGFYRHGSTCIGLERDGALVAATMYDFYNGASIYSNIAVAGPITREWLYRIFHYPFLQLGAKVLLGLVAEVNKKSQRLTEHFGFRLVAEIADADPSGSTLLYSLHRDYCTWIRRPHGKA